MQITKFDSKKILIISLTVLVILFSASAVIEPLLIKQTSDNWGIASKEIAFKQSQSIQDAIDVKSSQLHSISKKLESSLKQLEAYNNLTQKSVFELILNDEFSAYSIQINNNNFGLFAWNQEPPADSNAIKILSEFKGQTAFITNKLKNYLCQINLLQIKSQTFWIIVALPVSQLSLPKKAKEEITLLDSLRLELNTDLNITYGFEAKTKPDGRYYSFPILNNYKNKIGIASFPNPSLNQHLENLKIVFGRIQSLLLLLIALLMSIKLISSIRKVKSYLIRTILFSSLILSNRILMFLLELPSGWITSSITDSSNFSSRFAWGMVRSPLEFFISAIAFLGISFIGYKQIVIKDKATGSISKRNLGIEVGLIILSVFMCLLLWRGFGAVIRSVVFDSSIRYFKEFALIPSDAVFLMCINILILGFTIFLSSLALLVFIKKKLSILFDLKNIQLLVYFFIAIQISGFIFDALQSEPQGTGLIRFVFFTISFAILYLLTVKNYEFVYKYFLYALASSIISVSLLTYYNSQLEKESLKNSAYDLVRINDEQIQFILYQTLNEAKYNPDLITEIKNNRESSTRAFSIWMKSLIYREGINATISIYNSQKTKLGSFSSSNDKSIEAEITSLDQNKDIQIIPRLSVYGNSNQITGIATIDENGKVIGYLAISAIVSSSKFNYETIIKILMPERVGILSAVDYETLKVYEFFNKQLIRSTGEVSLSENDCRNIFSAPYDLFGEAWLEMLINGEKNLLFLVKTKTSSGEKILAIARENKNFTWNLSDFFKIFFIHAVVITSISLFFLFGKLKKERLSYISFRSKLIAAFLFLSIVPLFLIAAYLRNLTEDKNNTTLSKIMYDNIYQLRNYLEPYLLKSEIDRNLIFEKAAKELNKKFSVYADIEEIYSSNPSLYEAGILGAKLNPHAYQSVIVNKNKFYSGIEDVQGIKVNSAFGVLETATGKMIIEVNDLFNKTLSPLSEFELDVFLFGVFSFVMIIIIIISTVLSGQISSPIKKLTIATRAVSNGDLSVEVAVSSRSELGELANGFNMMVHKIKQNQIEIAQFEREEAWREMAKQVAHEIKNPLTPMKLSVQQLVTAYNDKSPKFNSIFEKVTSTIISQIETLKNIASEFSNFARMPRANLIRLNVSDVVTEVINLYAEQKNSISSFIESSEINVVADSDHLKRTMVNLIRNSFQAKADKIHIAVIRDNKLCVIRISDNGKGIPSDVLPNIFNENFTTKTSGMGLGLSMAKKYIESINGNIFVEKTDQHGTTFVISIPLAE